MTCASNVLLLRNPPHGSDKYDSVFRELGYTPHSVPVLETVFVNLGELRRQLVNGPQQAGYSGVIITSSRASEGWREVVRQIYEDDMDSEIKAVDWSQVPFYVVGETTAASLAKIKLDFNSPLAPADIRGAAESGTGERLAHFILNDLRSSHTPHGDPSSPPKLLYLTGDKNRETLPTILEGGGISLYPLQVYATQGAQTFSDGLDNLMRTYPSGMPHLWGWIVYFAPSSAEFTTPILRKRFQLPYAHSSTSDRALSTVRLAAIGPSTAHAVREKLGLMLAVIPEKPSPESLASAIKEFDVNNP